MDSELRTRVDIGLVLLATTTGAAAVIGAGTTDVATVAAGIFTAVFLTLVTLFLTTTPSWVDDGSDS
jgi:hypothetical protein